MTGETIFKWHLMAEQNIRTIMEEFSHLSADRLNYSSHIQRCTILEIFIHLIHVNHLCEKHLQSAISMNDSFGSFKIKAGIFTKPLLRTVLSQKCRKKPCCYPDKQQVFYELQKQQGILDELIMKWPYKEIHTSMGITFFGMVKVHFAEYMEYYFNLQKHHIIHARRLLMVQP